LKKYIIIFSVIAIGIIAYLLISARTKSGQNNISDTESQMLPKVLFLTTGGEEGNGEISEGVVVAIQSFNKKGAFVWLNTRDILLQPEVLSKYSIMVVPTSIGYHDGDKKYSLTFLSDIEMENIMDWVKKGGELIAEENIGRNTMDGMDRADINGEMNPQTWKLSELFGIKMKEKDLNGFSIEEKDAHIWNGRVKKITTDDEWVLIPTEITSDKAKVLAEWVNGTEKIPAIIQNDFGKGKAFLLTSTYLLHPSNDGGESSVEQIENFYDYVLNSSSKNKKFNVELNPWPNASSSAFCISFNSLGNDEQYKRVLNFLKEEKTPATFFIDSSLTSDEKKLLEDNKNINMQSNLYYREDFSSADYSVITRAILMDEQSFNSTFTGLRFPYNSTNFWGLLFANDKGYIYDSSIGVDHLTSYAGSVFPYNIPIAKDSYYKTLNLMEICPVKNDDIFYFVKSETGKDYLEDMQHNDAHLFEKYLMDFFEYAVKDNIGLMVYVGHPQFTGFSEITLQPLKKMMDTLKAKNCWITTLDEVASYRNKLKDLLVNISESGKSVKLKINLPEQTAIKELSFKLNSNPDNIDSKNNCNIKQINGIYYLITDVKNGDEINLSFK